MACRSLARSIRLLQEGGAPAGLSRRGRGGYSTPASRMMVRRSMANEPVPPGTACCSCERQILELRKEVLSENQRIWRMYEGLLEVNHQMLQKMCEIEAKAAERQVAAVEAMVKTSYRIIGSGGAFMFGMFMVLSPLLKAAWQQDTIEAMEKKTRLERVDTVIEGKGAVGLTGAASKGSLPDNVAEETGHIVHGPAAAVVNGETGGNGYLLAKAPEGTGRVVDGPADGDGSTKGSKEAETGSVPAQDTGKIPSAFFSWEMLPYRRRMRASDSSRVTRTRLRHTHSTWMGPTRHISILSQPRIFLYLIASLTPSSPHTPPLAVAATAPLPRWSPAPRLHRRRPRLHRRHARHHLRRWSPDPVAEPPGRQGSPPRAAAAANFSTFSTAGPPRAKLQLAADATTGRHRCYEPPPSMLRPSSSMLRPPSSVLQAPTAKAASGGHRCYHRLPPMLRPFTTDAMTGRRRCYKAHCQSCKQRPPMLRPAAVDATTGGRRCCKLLLAWWWCYHGKEFFCYNGPAAGDGSTKVGKVAETGSLPAQDTGSKN